MAGKAKKFQKKGALGQLQHACKVIGLVVWQNTLHHNIGIVFMNMVASNKELDNLVRRLEQEKWG